jgi:hypothetical protein
MSLSKVLFGVMVVVFLATMFLAVQWFTTSIVITRQGPVQWAEGLERTKEHWLGD